MATHLAHQRLNDAVRRHDVRDSSLARSKREIALVTSPLLHALVMATFMPITSSWCCESGVTLAARVRPRGRVMADNVNCQTRLGCGGVVTVSTGERMSRTAACDVSFQVGF